MPIDPSFKEDLDRTLHGLESCQKELKGLYGRALVDKLPEPVQRLLQRKAGLLGHLREDLDQIPAIVEAHDKRELERRRQGAVGR